jgi:DNA-binding HxlR family transcriptional regulator
VHTSTKQVATSSSEADRSYGQFCGLARALDLVGERWAFLVVRELALGPKRFKDLADGLPGVSTNILASRLRQLERNGIVERRVLPPPAASSVYELTEYGRDLEPAMLALGRWGARSLGPRGERVLRSHWLALALKGMFRPEAADGRARTYEIRLSDGSFVARVRKRAVDVTAGAAEDADLVLEADDDGLVALLMTGSTEGVRVLDGASSELDRFVELFGFS